MASTGTPFETATSADGTAIAYQRRGGGHPVVLIGGAFGVRSTADALADVLAPHYTAVTYDRRGRGDSGDGDAYSVLHEVEDLAAVIDAAGGHAHVFGHSSGACLAVEASQRGVAIDRMALYEPPYIPDGVHPRPAADLAARLRELLREGRRDDAVALFQVEAIGLPPAMVEGFKSTPMWAGLTTLAHTLPYDVDLTGPGNVLPADRLGTIAVPTLVMVGTTGIAWMPVAARAVTAAIPGARLLTLDGLDHGGPNSHPDVLLPALRDFLR
jgi:pimeloyl-ACP methyl ester carboxylesterase